MTLEWEDVSPTAARTTCNRYTVGALDDQWETWMYVPGGPWFTLIAKELGSIEAAKEAAEKHAEARAA